MTNKDRHARVDRKCEWCNKKFFARLERVQAGQGRFCSLSCANLWQKENAKLNWGFENGKKYFMGGKWVVQWRDAKGFHNTSFPKWWWIQNIGEVPDGYVVSLKDGDPNNINPSNFELVKKGRIWVKNGKGNKARTGMKWDDQHRLDITNRMRKNWQDGKYDDVHVGENHYNWKGGKSREEYPREFYQIREAVLERDNYRCRVCGRELSNLGTAHVHHRDANKNNNDPENLLSLCINCHAEVHSNKPTNEVFMALRSELYQ